MKPEPKSRHSGPNHDGSARSSPYPISRLAGPISLVDTAARIEAASEIVSLRTNAKLEVIAREIQALQDAAREVLAQAEHDLNLHHAECAFRRVNGRTYHLFERADGARYFSMLSPSELGPTRDTFIASFRYEPDQSFTRVSAAEAGPAPSEASRPRRLGA